MTQVSRPQSGRLVDGYVDAGGYTANQWARVYSTLFTVDETTQGVIKHLSDLEVTNPGAPSDDISVASGAALVRGHWFVNEDQGNPAAASAVDFIPTTPAAARIDRVVLVQNNTDLAYDGTTDYGSAVLEVPADLTDYDGAASVPAHTCRLAILTGVAGGAMRALTQDVSVTGDIWMIEIARYTISDAGVISGLTDYRSFIGGTGTRSVFVPAVAGWNTTDSASITPAGYNAGGSHSEVGIRLPDAKDACAVGSWAFPEDFDGDLTIQAVGFAEGVASGGNFYGANKLSWGLRGVAFYQEAFFPSADPDNDNWFDEGAQALSNTPVPGDTYVTLEYKRYGDTEAATDTSTNALWIKGWYLTYTAKPE